MPVYSFFHFWVIYTHTGLRAINISDRNNEKKLKTKQRKKQKEGNPWVVCQCSAFADLIIQM